MVKEVFGRVKKIRKNVRLGIRKGGMWRKRKEDKIG